MYGILNDFQKMPLAFGGASISGEGAGYGFGDISEDDAISLLRYSLERGVNIFDTAPIYGFGLSEKRIGKAFKQMREKVFITSKSGVTWHDNMRVDMTNDPSTTKKMLEQSLRDLDSDYIDLFMIHWPDKKVDLRRPIEILAKAQQDGKVKHIGLCNTNLSDLKKASELVKVEAIQSELNYFSQEVVKDILKVVIEQRMSFMSWGTLDKGILTGRVNKNRIFDKSDCRSWAPWWKAMKKDSKYDLVSRLKPIVEKRGHSLLEFALSFNLSNPGVSTLLCWALNHQQLDGLISALSNRVSLEMISEISRELDAH